MANGVCGLRGLRVPPRAVPLNVQEHASVTILQPRMEEKHARDLRNRRSTVNYNRA